MWASRPVAVQTSLPEVPLDVVALHLPVHSASTALATAVRTTMEPEFVQAQAADEHSRAAQEVVHYASASAQATLAWPVEVMVVVDVPAVVDGLSGQVAAAVCDSAQVPV